MTIDISAKSVQILEKLANSLHERDGSMKNFCFTTHEVRIVEDWLREQLGSVIKSMSEA